MEGILKDQIEGSELIQRAILENIPAYVFLKDTNLRYTAVNHAYYDMLPKSVTDAVGKCDRDFYPSRLADIFEAEDLRVLTHGETIHKEEPVKLRDGRVVHLAVCLSPVKNKAGRIVAMIGIGVDITRRKKSEETLQKVHRYHEQIISTAATAIFTVDKQMYITSVNDEFCSVTGFSRDELIGKSCDILQGSPCMKHCGLFDPNRKDRIFKKQCSIRTKDGRRLTIIKNADLLCDESGKSLGGIESFVDVTELADARRDAEQASTAKSQFLANMSHEIRTPMNGVIGMSQLLMATNLNPQQKRYARTICRSADALLGLINDILDFSKIEADQLNVESAPFDMYQIADEVAHLVSPAVENKPVEVAVRYGPDTPHWLIGDATRIRQILLNLAGNAVKFTNEGRVLINVKHQSLSDGKMKLHVAIEDTGIGIPKDKLKYIFDKFTQADTSTTRKFGGTGLGLAICRKLVEIMGGKIWVESVQDKGSTFNFTIDTSISKERLPESQTLSHDCGGGVIIQSAGTQDNQRMLQILVAEDNPVNQDVAVELLQTLGHSVAVANNGLEAIAAMEKTQFDLIFMDVQMPEMGGFEATAEIRKKQSGTNLRVPIVAMTAHAMKEDRQRCIDAGMDDYVSKPINWEDLVAVIDRIVPGDGENAKSQTTENPADKDDILPDEEQTILDYDTLLNRCMGKEAIVHRVLMLFEQTAGDIVTRMEQALSHGDTDQAGAEAHSLKGAAANISAEPLRKIAAEVERLAKAGSEAAARTNLLKLQLQLELCLECIGGIISAENTTQPNTGNTP